MALVFALMNDLPSNVNPFPAAQSAYLQSSAEYRNKAVEAAMVNVFVSSFSQPGDTDVAEPTAMASIAGDAGQVAARVEIIAAAIESTADLQSRFRRLLLSPVCQARVGLALKNLFDAVASGQRELSIMLSTHFYRTVSLTYHWSYLSSAELFLDWTTQILDAWVTDDKKYMSWFGILDPAHPAAFKFQPCERLGGGAFGVVCSGDLFIGERHFARSVCKVQDVGDCAFSEAALLENISLDPYLPPAVSWAFGSACSYLYLLFSSVLQCFAHRQFTDCRLFSARPRR